MTHPSLRAGLAEGYRWATMPYRWWALQWARRRGTLPIAILYYHRVDDRDLNPWTIRPDEFQRQIDWLQKRFDLISLEEVQRRIRGGFNDRPAVSITFDDGYADNCAWALPLLIERSIPVTYFVTTRHVMTGEPFPHDVQRGVPHHPNSIESLKSLAAAGVEIGAHTRTHANLGQIDNPSTLYDEVIGGARDLSLALGRRIRYFAFPYGLPHNLNRHVFELARSHGLAGVCSAFGDFNEIRGDGFHLRRFHGDRSLTVIRNWLTLDPRRRVRRDQWMDLIPEPGGHPGDDRQPQSDARRLVGGGHLSPSDRTHNDHSKPVTSFSPPLPGELRSEPLRVLFINTSLPVGGAETLLVNLVENFDPQVIQPHICCLKEPGPLGEALKKRFPLSHGLIGHKLDVRIVIKLVRLMRSQRIDAVVTVGAGDKMFWGRLAARLAGVPVIISALHSTGWPDEVRWLNRRLTCITDAFVAVAEHHHQFLIDHLGFPAEKVRIVPNGVDTRRLRWRVHKRKQWRGKLNIGSDAPVALIVAALRPEKNHRLFVDMAARVLHSVPEAQFLIAGDGPQRPEILNYIQQQGLGHNVKLLGNCDDIPGLLSAADVFCLTSDNEASPVSILEALSCQRPVVSTDVGSVSESVVDGLTGYVVPVGDADRFSQCLSKLMQDRKLARQMGEAGRRLVLEQGSLQSMVTGYRDLIRELYQQKTGVRLQSLEGQSRGEIPAVTWSPSAEAVDV